MNINASADIFVKKESNTIKSNLLFFLLAAYSLLCPFLYIPHLVGDTDLPISDILLPLVLAFFIIVPALRYNFTALFTVLFVFVTLLSVLTNAGRGVPLGVNIVQMIRLLGIFAPLLLLFSSAKLQPAQFVNLVRLLWVGSLIAVLAGIVLHILGIQVRSGQQELWGSGLGRVLRAGGLTGNTAEYGHISAIWLSISVLFSKYIFGKYGRISIIFCVGVYIYVAIISSSRGSIVDMVAMLTYFAVAASSGSYKKQFQSLAIVVGSLLFYVLALWSLKGHNTFLDLSLARIDFFGLFYNSDTLSNGRFNMWSDILDNYSFSNIFGIGYKNTGYFYTRLFDNSFVTCFVEQGIFGFLSFVGIMGTMFWAVHRKATSGSIFATKINAMLFGFAAHALTLDIHTIWVTTPAFFSLVVAFLCMTETSEVLNRRQGGRRNTKRSMASV